jgi:hypothetical protein
MSLQGIISDILVDEFYAVYCDSCANKGNDDCDDCHRKNMKWRLSRNEAVRVAGSIVADYANSLVDDN